MIKIGDEIKIIGIDKDDAHYSCRKELIGMIGVVTNIYQTTKNLYCCQINNVKNQKMDMYYFKLVKIKKLNKG